jgi:hypothetical protein
MLLLGASFPDAILAIHILAVLVAFGVTFAYPLFDRVGGRLDKRSMPWFHRLQQTISRRLTNPALGVVLAAGIYLATDEHQWSHFYVQWGVAAVIVLGGLEGALVTPRSGRLAELASRDVEMARGQDVTWSPEYQTAGRQVEMVRAGMALIVALTIFFMALHL